MSATNHNDQTVVVVGAGAAGMAAALSAARAGAAVALLESRPRIGGTVAHALIHTIGGLHDSEGGVLNPGLPAELADRLTRASSSSRKRSIGRCWTLSVDPGVYQQVAERWIGEHASIEVIAGASLIGVAEHNGSVETIDLRSGDGEVQTRRVAAVIDASGSAELVRCLSPERVIDGQDRSAAGLIVRLGGVSEKLLAFPRGVAVMRRIKLAVERGELSSGCLNAWLDLGVAENEGFLKLFVPLEDAAVHDESAQRRLEEARQARDEIVTFLRAMDGFENLSIIETGEPGVRDGGRVLGEYTLSEDDVRSMRRFPDAVARACWPIEFWDQSTGVRLDYLPPGGYYEIPMRSLRLPGIENLWVAGKCLSADRAAHASARVAGTCWAMGEAVGKAAAQHAKGIEASRSVQLATTST